MSSPLITRPPAWIDDADCNIDDFRAQVLRPTHLADYPHAHDVRLGVLVYRAADFGRADRRALQAELVGALTDGPGVVVFEGAYDADVVDAASVAFTELIDAQRAEGSAAGDHFGKPGANDRIWNAAQKLALHAPEVFAEYYANDALAVVSQAWLGPRYQVTSQVNVVNPGGAAQVPHRDYHLGFVNAEQLMDYPAHLHRMSAVLTLQGAVAHCDMPLESGPTMLLPYSQRFAAGYVAFYRPEFLDFFAEHLSSPFGRAMESLDRTAMVRAVYPALRAMRSADRPAHEVLNAVVATAEGYPFPTNLDHDQPIGSLAPPSQVDVVLQALDADLDVAELDAALRAQNERTIP